jgi:hypothetical protein
VTEHDDGDHSHGSAEDPAHETPVGPSTAVGEEPPHERSEEPADDEAHEAANQSTECGEARKAGWLRVAWNSVHDGKVGSRDSEAERCVRTPRGEKPPYRDSSGRTPHDCTRVATLWSWNV